MSGGLPEHLQRGIRLLNLWKAVRPGSHWLGVPTAELHAEGLCREILTPLGTGLTLSARGYRLLGKRSDILSETSISNILYQQDALPALRQLGYQGLLPGNPPYRNVLDGHRKHPLIGRYTSKGYGRTTVLHHYTKLEPDLMTRQVYLIVLHPFPETLKPMPKLQIVYLPPQWQ